MENLREDPTVLYHHCEPNIFAREFFGGLASGLSW